MSNFIVGKKYRMRNGELAEFERKWTKDFLVFNTKLKVGIQTIITTLSGEVEKAALVEGLTHDYDIISDTPIEEEGQKLWAVDFGTNEVHLNRTEEQKKLPLFVDGRQVYPRRQFDVSKLRKEKEQRSWCDAEIANTKYNTRLQVLEAWNNGTIEELLTTWVESPKGE